MLINFSLYKEPMAFLKLFLLICTNCFMTSGLDLSFNPKKPSLSSSSVEIDKEVVKSDEVNLSEEVKDKVNQSNLNKKLPEAS